MSGGAKEAFYGEAGLPPHKMNRRAWRQVKTAANDHESCRLPEDVAALRAHLEAEPDLELAERCEHLEKERRLALERADALASDARPGLDAKKKTLAAREQDPENGLAFRKCLLRKWKPANMRGLK